jgi:hypothetical protein
LNEANVFVLGNFLFLNVEAVSDVLSSSAMVERRFKSSYLLILNSIGIVTSRNHKKLQGTSLTRDARVGKVLRVNALQVTASC